jgi:hypothetical protein
MNSKRVAASIGVIATLLLATAFGVQSASAARPSEEQRVLNFTPILDTLQPLDTGTPGPSAGDSFFLTSHWSNSMSSGKVATSCVLVTLANGGVRQCEVDFSTSNGDITTRGLTDATNSLVRLAVTGGTGRFAGVTGDGTLTPTATGSVVELHLAPSGG